jgi:hypothetical protein
VVHWHLQKFLQCTKYITFEFTPPLLSFIPPPLVPVTVSTSIIFAFTYMYTNYFHCIHPPVLFPYHLPLPLVPTPTAALPSRTCSALLFSNFVEEKRQKKYMFLLV